MKLRMQVVMVSLAAGTLFGCGNSEQPIAETKMAEQAPAVVGGMTGRVVETMDSGGYTYVQIDTGSEKVWAAGPQTAVAVGDMISVPGGMIKENFTSKTLERTFDRIYFVTSLNKPGEAASTSPHAPQEDMGGQTRTVAPAPVAMDFSGITKPEGGISVADVYASKDSLAGKKVQLRGKVVKFNSGIMGKNWVHVQDGTGAAGANDLTVTTQGTANVGDTVLIEGAVVLDKDFGFGYKYALLIEDATVTVE